MSAPLRTVLVGAGRIGAGYADDPLTARHYPYATHAQVLADHPAFAWEAVVDPCDDARARAAQRWGVPRTAAGVHELDEIDTLDMAVIATPPEHRLDVIDQLPALQGVIVEKPLGRTPGEAERLVETCRDRGILVQVNFWRRADELTRSLAEGDLERLIGPAQAVSGVYGNGLANNGTHMIDLARMLLGEVTAVQALGECPPRASGDPNVPFVLTMRSGLLVTMQPLEFSHYRENSLEIWGERGRLSIMNEGLCTFVHIAGPHRALQNTHEVAADRPRPLEPTAGRALYRIYDDLALAMREAAPPVSSGDSALQTTRIVHAVLESERLGGQPLSPAPGLEVGR